MRERTVTGPSWERMRGSCWNAKALGKLMRVKSLDFPFRRHIMEPSWPEILYTVEQ